MECTCIVERCDRGPYCRGLCRPCYLAALRRVKAGATTWAELEQRGLALPAARCNRFVEQFVGGDGASSAGASSASTRADIRKAGTKRKPASRTNRQPRMGQD